MIMVLTDEILDRTNAMNDLCIHPPKTGDYIVLSVLLKVKPLSLAPTGPHINDIGREAGAAEATPAR